MGNAREEIFRALRYRSAPMGADQASILLDDHQKSVTKQTVINICLMLSIRQEEMTSEQAVQLIKERYQQLLEL